MAINRFETCVIVVRIVQHSVKQDLSQTHLAFAAIHPRRQKGAITPWIFIPRASGFTEAISFHIGCESQDEIDHYWERLSDGGLEQACGWLKDKFGVSWQVVPSALIDMLSDPDPEKASRVTNAMLQMTKIDIAELERARDGGV